MSGLIQQILFILFLFFTTGFNQSGQANLTWYTSYPDPGSEECIVYNGCQWAGYFYGLPDQQTEEWVSQNNIIAIHEKDWEKYGLKTLRLTQGDKQIDGVVYDLCADSDCNGCCTQNASQNGLDFLIDIESHTKERFGSSSGIVNWECLDCEGPVAPSITTQPSDQKVIVGQKATFSITASGTSLNYQWKKNNNNISGATSPTYTTPNLNIADDGNTYSVTVSNSGGSVTTNPATLTVKTSSNNSGNRKVITWVPPYSIPESKAMLQKDFGGIGVKDGLTHLALQFWIPSGDRKSAILSPTYSYAISDEEIEWFKNWGQANGVKVLLCVYNADVPGSEGWDWDAATSAFVNNQDSFVSSLLSEMNKYGLDGIEVDLEGPGADDTYQSQFLSFMTKLSNELHPQGKELTVATFAYVWNAPNTNWWPDLMKVVDGITSMGYEIIGRNGADWASYSSQKGFAPNPNKLMIGMPGTQNSWLNNSVVEQIDWVIQDGETGVAIWDVTLAASGWQTKEVWEMLSQIKGSVPDNFMLSIQSENGTVILDPPGGAYEPGTEVTLTAYPNDEFEFDAWGGDVEGEDNPVKIIVSENTNITANFIGETMAVDRVTPKTHHLIFNGQNFSFQHQVKRIKINDLYGKLIEEIDTNEKHYITPSDISSGLYVVQFITSHSSKIYRMYMH